MEQHASRIEVGFCDARNRLYCVTRLYGSRAEDAILTMLIFFEKGYSEELVEHIRSIAKDIKCYILLRRITACGNAKSTPTNTEKSDYPDAFRQYNKVLVHGSSIAPKGGSSAGSFGGYVTFGSEIYGMSNSHVLCRDGRAVQMGDAGPEIESPAAGDVFELCKDLMTAQEKLNKVTKNDPTYESIQEKLRIIKYHLDTHNLESGDLDAGVVVAASGGLVSGLHLAGTMDWSLIRLQPHRIGLNEFPGRRWWPLTPLHPRRIGRVVQEYEGHDKLVAQEICFRGRSSGTAKGYVRTLETLSVNSERGVAFFAQGYSICLTASDNVGTPRVRPGDSGSWMFENELGQPIAQITYCNEVEGLAISLENIFSEIEDVIGQKLKLA